MNDNLSTIDTNRLFTGTAGDSAYVDLPTPAAYLRWVRGDAAFKHLKDADPSKYFGGWRAPVRDKDGNPFPALPLPIVDRVSQDGQVTYPVYASNVIEFVPLATRLRFELRGTTKDPVTGRDKVIVHEIARERKQGFSPLLQVYGLVFNGDENAPAVLYIDKWSSFISYEKAERRWQKVRAPLGKVLARRLGTVGKKDASGNAIPNFEIYGESRSTPIEAIGFTEPRFIPLTEEIIQLLQDARDWRECLKWNGEGRLESPEPAIKTIYDKFMEKANAIGLTNIEIEQLVAQSGNNYAKALEMLEGGLDADLEAANAAVAETDELPF